MTVAAISLARRDWLVVPDIHPAIVTGFILAAVVALWEVLCRTALADLYVLAAPSEIVARLIENPGLYWRATVATLGEAGLGFLVGNLAAVLLAAVVAVLPPIEKVVHGVALVVFCLPLVATGPVLRVVFGANIGPQVVLAALAVYYTTFVPVVVGLRVVPASWPDLIASYGRGRWQTLIHVRARAAVPYLIAGLQIAAPAAVLGAMVGEFTGAERGMGVLVIQAIRSLDIAGTWTIAAVATAASIAGYVIVGAVGRFLSHGAPPLLLTARAGGASGSAVRRAGIALLTLAATIVLTLVLWTGSMSLLGLNPFFAKRPEDVLAFMVTGADAEAHRAAVLGALGTTLSVTIPGYFVGLAVGVVIAAVFELMPVVRRTMTPIAIALRSVPIIATAPLVILALGRGAAGLLTIVAIMTFFPTLVASAQGLRQTPGQVIDFFDSYAAGPVRKLFLARMPAMLPAFFAAARIAVPTAVLAATVAEWLATGTGIGNLMALTYSTSSYNVLWSCVVVLTIVSVAGYALVGAVERIVLAQVAPEQVNR